MKEKSIYEAPNCRYSDTLGMMCESFFCYSPNHAFLDSPGDYTIGENVNEYGEL